METMRSMDRGRMAAEPEKPMPGQKRPMAGPNEDPHAAGDPEPHRMALSKMHPAHAHRLIQMAHEGKFGPDAQRHAQMAMSDNDGDEGGASPGSENEPASDQRSGPAGRDIFGGQEGQPQRPQGASPDMSPHGSGQEDVEQTRQPMRASRIFGGR